MTGRTKQSKPAGRKLTGEKLDSAQAAEVCLPEGFALADCCHVRDRVVWRIIDGKAVLVAYEIGHGPGGQKPVIDGVLPRSEFGFSEDGRLGNAGRRALIAALFDELSEACLVRCDFTYQDFI
ncbi:MAG: hypothetical protein R3C19_10695 [Planctomycetaceae bacterium]